MQDIPISLSNIHIPVPTKHNLSMNLGPWYAISELNYTCQLTLIILKTCPGFRILLQICCFIGFIPQDYRNRTIKRLSQLIAKQQEQEWYVIHPLKLKQFKLNCSVSSCVQYTKVQCNVRDLSASLLLHLELFAICEFELR